jgi:hypothetical protein
MNTNVISGTLLWLLGLLTSFYTYQNYHIGSPANIGPGFFPFYLGLMLAGFSFISTVISFNKVFKNLIIDYFTLVVIISSVVIFGILLNIVGIIIATIISVTAATYASKKYSTFLSRIITAITIALINWLLFVFLLGMHIPTWPNIG